MACGVGKYFRYVPVHEIYASLGPHKSLALPFFHAFTGCDTVSQFHRIGKKTAWETWNTHEKFTAVFLRLAAAPQELTEEDISSMEEFTVLLYDRTSTIKSVDELRLVLFTHKGRQMLDLPPTRGALEQHIKRAVLQGGFYWSSTTSPTRVLPSPSIWGWVMSDAWKPFSTSKPEAASSCTELTRCKCRSKCADCVCVKAGLKCTLYCGCKGNCQNNISPELSCCGDGHLV